MELNSNLASLSLVAVVHTMISIPGIIFGGYLFPTSQSVLSARHTKVCATGHFLALKACL